MRLENPGGSGRLEAEWNAGNDFTVIVNITDGRAHDIGLYALDWESQQRDEQIKVTDATTGAVLDTETAAHFSAGVYFQWVVTGSVMIDVTRTYWSNAVLTGIFFDPPTSASAYVAKDSATQGNWIGAYGSQGYNIVGGATSYPAHAAVQPSGALTTSWATTTNDPRGARELNGQQSSRRRLEFGNDNDHRHRAIRWPGPRHPSVRSRLGQPGEKRADPTLESGNRGRVRQRNRLVVLGRRYLEWRVFGSITITVTRLSGPDAVVSGLFFDPPSISSSTVNTATASIVKQDPKTEGTWHSVYGSQGWGVASVGRNFPSDDLQVLGSTLYTWAATTADPRAPQTASTTRAAAAWESATSFVVELEIPDSTAHALTLYAVDWDGNNSRSELIQISSAATGAILDTRAINNFTNGIYLQWDVTGNVVITITRLAGANAVLSGIFLDSASTPQTPSPATRDLTTLGNWIGAYGPQGYNIIGSSAVYPSYAIVTPPANSTFTWAANSADPRALQTANGSSRIASSWAGATFSIDVNLTDGQLHSLTLYALDWDSAGRSEQIEIASATTGAILDTETLSSFSGGVYLQWMVSGHIVIEVTRLGGPNAVISGLFFDTKPTAQSASSAIVDTTTQGNWIGVYGTQGYKSSVGARSVPPTPP